MSGLLAHRGLLAAATGDPFSANVGFLLHFDGAAGSTSFPDSGPHGKTFTLAGAGGTAQIDTSQSVFGGASYRQTGSISRRITTPADATYITAAGSTPWTWESRCRITSFSTNRVLFDNNNNATNTTGWQIYVDTAGKIFVYSGPQATSYGGHGTALALSTWYALAITWDGTTLRFFRDGALLGGNTGFTNVWGTSVLLWNSANSNQAADGYFDELRWTKGVARYTGAYAVDSQPW